MDKIINAKDIPSKSFWLDSTSETNYPVLKEDIKVDVAVIGAGITGITAAYLLKKEGFSVALIDADRIAQGTTGHTTAFLTSQHDLIYSNLIKSMGIDRAKQYASANEEAINFIEALIGEFNIDCDFKRLPAYIYTRDENFVGQIHDEVSAALKIGLRVKYIDNLPLPFENKGAICFENQGEFHPRKYLLPIAEKIIGDGCYIFEHTRVVDIKDDGLLYAVTDTGFKINASKVILASHFPFYDGLGLYFTRLVPVRSYVISAKINVELPIGTFVSAEDPSRYFRMQNFRDNNMLILGGEDHKVVHGDNFIKHYNNLKDFAELYFGAKEYLYRWSAQDYLTLDGVPYVGYLKKGKENIYAATGYGEWGMTNGTAAAIILRDLIVKGESPYMEVYNPSRGTSIDAAKNFVMGNLDVAKQLISGKFKSAEVGLNIKRDEAKVVEIDGKKYGAYRDKKSLHIVDITCTHVGCELRWNDAEKTWDCPCHGSRFSYEGDIIEGPAVTRLNYYKDEPNTIDSNINE